MHSISRKMVDYLVVVHGKYRPNGANTYTEHM